MAGTAAVLLGASLLLASCGPPQPADDLHTISGTALGTSYTVKTTVHADKQTFDAILADIDLSMSTYRPDSEISRFNDSQETTWFPVSPDFVTVVKTARTVSEQTGGALDITAAPLFELWSPNETATPPPALAVAEARLHINFHNIAVQTSPPALRKNYPATRIDVSAVAKGFAVDAIATHLEETGHVAYMVEIGGEIRSRGRKPDGTPFRIGIENPTPGERSIHSSVPLENASMATSGDYRNFFTHNGKHYSHIIDPRTGSPVDHDLAAVTVISRDATSHADALATALLVMGPDQGYAFAEQNHLAALFIQRSPEGVTTTRTTTGFDTLSPPQP